MKKARSFNRIGISLVICCMLSWSVFSFFCTNSYQVFAPAVAAEHGVEFADLHIWNTYGGLVAAVGTLIAAYVVHKTGPRWCMAISMILAGLNYTLFPSYPTAILGIGIAVNAIMQPFYCNLPTNILMANWYPRKNAVVMGWVTGAIALGGVIYLPIFNRVMQSSGIDTAMRMFGIPVIIFGVICIFWVKDTPEQMGLEPDGMPMSDEERQKIIAKKNEKNPWTLPKVLTNKRMLAFSVAWGLEFIVLVGVSTVGIPILTSKGMSQNEAVALAAFGAVANLVGSVASGHLADWLGTMKASVLCVAIQCAGALCMGLATVGTRPLLIAGYVACMLITGAPSNLIATGVLRLTGARYYSLAWGTIFMVINLFRAFASTFVSVSLKVTGGYTGALYVFAGILVVSILLLIYAGEKYQEPPLIEAPAAEAAHD